MRARSVVAAVTCALLATACTIGPRYVAPAAPSVDRYTAGPAPQHTVTSAGASQRFDYGARLNAQWWTLFRSPALDALLRASLQHNPTLDAAQATLRQAQATLEADAGLFYPQVTGQLGTQRERFSGATFGGSVPPRLFTLYTGSLNVTYYPDFFGANRLVYRQQKAQVDYQQFQLQAAYLTLEANVVSQGITAAELTEEIRTTRAIIAAEAQLLTLTENRYRLGAAPYLDVLNQRNQLATSRAALPPLEQRLAQTRHQLAILAGEYPAQWKEPDWTDGEIRLPRDLPVSLPSTLVQQRPDIRAAEAQMRAANAQVGIDSAKMYPILALTGSFGQQSGLPQAFFNSGGNVWSLAAGLTQPLFQGGTLRAQRRAAQAAYEATAAEYRKTVLGAFAQVADALRAVQHDAEALHAQQQALQTAREALDLAKAQYTDGAIDYLTLLTTQVSYHNASILVLQTQAHRLRDTAALFAAVGGGWWSEQPTPPGSAPAAAARTVTEPTAKTTIAPASAANRRTP
ncbi:MAG: hypothetical protein B7Z66_00075 [Chromatiales bacterium 21-64-14]|nr:MAG: hypothetical protein B7Z66_00075 [Chromatiales bacterium 21-64-14]